MERLKNLKWFFLEHKYWIIIIGIIIILFLGIGGYFVYPYFVGQKEDVLLIENEEENETTEILEENDQVLENLCQVTVDIKGKVKFPGLYQLECNLRVQDAIDLAGGVTWDADTSVLNLSKKVIDEMVIIVYSKEQVANFVSTKEEEKVKVESCESQLEVTNDACMKQEDILGTSAEDNNVIGDTPVNSLISLNTATQEELMTLSGIGESKAKNIILYREEHGGFQSIEEIKNVNGIGESIFEKIKDSITV